ncbi:MAG: sigma-54-dependent Fis family transcriptional regulator, partial [bacterium]|nr:sigma-54-dependent Fis family transcriptional regulator [bacterium]
MALCLIVEDQHLQRKTLHATLHDAGYQALACACGKEGLALCAEHRPEMVLLDLGLPDIDGLDLIPPLLDASPLTRIVVLTGRDSVSEAVAALRAGARHYLVKPWDREELLLVLGREVAAVTQEEVRRRSGSTDVFWGANPGMREVRNAIERLAESQWTPVLLRGETGTGKEVVARELHRLTNPPGSLVILNCAAIPGELMESELFGHERGAFTGADTRRRGLVELADEGTLLLDEVGEMAPHLQAKLLRFLQGGSFRRLGSESELHSRCRVVASTHADLEAMQNEGDFREDLYYRLAVVSLHLPPLREREEDLLPLTHYLLERISLQLGRPP